ncbi:MAG: HipA family kinase [Planctomycetota bacterium]
MLGHRYHIHKNAWGPNKATGLSQRQRRIVGINALAKKNPDHEFEIYNELVASRLGQYMGLPIPVGMVLEKDSELFYASCHVSAATEELPDADLNRFCRDKADLACGVMVFDAWTANDDRHLENIWYNYYEDETFVFDQGNALLSDEGESHLHSAEKCLCVRYANDALSQFITSLDSFSIWYEAILRIPTSAITALVIEASAVGVDKMLGEKVGAWLLKRREILPRLFRDEVGRFPRLEMSLLDPFAGYENDPPPEYII